MSENINVIVLSLSFFFFMFWLTEATMGKRDILVHVASYKPAQTTSKDYQNEDHCRGKNNEKKDKVENQVFDSHYMTGRIWYENKQGSKLHLNKSKGFNVQTLFINHFVDECIFRAEAQNMLGMYWQINETDGTITLEKGDHDDARQFFEVTAIGGGLLTMHSISKNKWFLQEDASKNIGEEYCHVDSNTPIFSRPLDDCPGAKKWKIYDP